MAQYRVYWINENGAHIGVADVECRDDSLALTEARQLAGLAHVELWEGKRLVGAFNLPPTLEAA